MVMTMQAPAEGDERTLPSTSCTSKKAAAGEK